MLVDDLAYVDVFDPRLSQRETVALTLAKDRVQRYIAAGKLHQAEGAMRVLLIFWRSLLEDDSIDTGWGQLG